MREISKKETKTFRTNTKKIKIRWEFSKKVKKSIKLIAGKNVRNEGKIKNKLQEKICKKIANKIPKTKNGVANKKFKKKSGGKLKKKLTKNFNNKK